MTITLDTINLFVQNMEKTLTFYTFLGFTFSEEDYAKNYVKIDNGSVSLCFYNLEIVEEYFSHDLIKSNSNHQFELSFRVNDPDEVDAIYDELINHGYDSFKKPENSNWHQRVAFILDPDNNLIEISAFLNVLKKDE